MPLLKLQLRPGINRESTSLANKGGWFACDKVRFRTGAPEKIGGWEQDSGTVYSGGVVAVPTSGLFFGIARLLVAWVLLNGNKTLGIGTSSKFNIQQGASGIIYDATPIRATTAAGGVAFAATNGSSVVVVTDVAHGARQDSFVTFTASASLGGALTAAVMNREFQITYISTDTYSIDTGVTANGSDTGNGGAAVYATYQINARAEIAVPASGWGAEGWGTGAWGDDASASDDPQVGLWSVGVYGENLLINPRGGALYMWVPSGVMGTVNRASLLSSTSAGVYTTDVDCPTTCNIVTVSDTSRFVLAFGVNDYGSATRDPLLVRWSGQEDYRVWTPAITNQAGSYKLSIGSEIRAIRQTRQEILVWTDAALYSMQYIGPPYVWGFQLLADNISMPSPNAAESVNGVTYWMGDGNFYQYSGSVDTMQCTVRQYVFSNINRDQAFQFFAGINEVFNEIWWFYCSADSTEIDRYVIYNYVDKVWAYGTMQRTAWLNANIFQTPLAAGYDGLLLHHESGVDDGSTSPSTAISAYIRSSDFDIEDGHQYQFVWRMLPDVTFDGSTSAAPEVQMSMIPRQNPGAAYGTAPDPDVVSVNNFTGQRTYTVQQFTEIVYTRVRGRQMALQLSSDTLGTQWQWGVPIIDTRPDGRR